MRILAIDYGEARTGLALSDYTGLIASPFTVLLDRNMDWLVKRIVSAVNDNEVGEIVVGNPLNMDGTQGEKSVKCELLAAKLRESTDISVVMWDERLTTVTAHEIISENRNAYRGGKSRRRRPASGGTPVDAVAAAVILQSYLDSHRNSIR
jgi:putative Holliday junction resolvase